jgi:hypothetical protein
MKKSLILAAAALLAQGAIFADTLLWYRFDGDGTTIENKANPGVMDGTLRSIDHWGWAGSQPFGDDDTKFPVRAAAFADGVRVIDPKTDTLYPNGKAMSWTGDSGNTGAIYVPGSALTAAFKGAKSYTYEAFFKMSQAAIDRATTSGGNVMFPIIHWGKDTSSAATQEGAMFALYYNSGKLAPYFRMGVETNGLVVVSAYSAAWLMGSITLDVWHHLALVASADTDAKKLSLTVYIDYHSVGGANVTGYEGMHYSDANALPLVIGANPYNGGRSFLGELAEVRVSDAALDVREFLRPVPPGPVDADTLVYLPLGDTPWFATQAPLATGVWNPPLNGAPTAAWNPTGWKTTSVSGNLPYGVPAVADEAHGSTVRGGCLDTNALADVKSYTFSSGTVNGNTIGHIVEFPKDGLADLYAGDFTFEWFFKTDYQSNHAMLVNPWTKVMINGGKVHSRVGDYNIGGGTGSAVVNDGAWHHCALVYRHGVNAFECWVDYKLDNILGAAALASNNQGFYFGGQGYYTQVFNGQLDDLRITKRALAPHEFLTTVPVAAGASATDILHAPLETSLASGQDEFFVSNGVVRVAGTNAKGTASYADISREIDYDNNGKADAISTKALVLDGSNYLAFDSEGVLMTRDFTAEFFAKVTGTGNNAQFVRLAVSTAVGNSSRWALAPNGTVSVLRSVNGTYIDKATTSQSVAANPALSIADGKWHHWAVTASADYAGTNTTVKVYRDYEEVAGGTFANSVIYFGTAEHSLLFGYSNNANGGMQAQFDEIRFRPGVQPVSSFMRRVPSSRATVLIFR